MDSFSWTDGFRATVSTCLPCFTNHNSPSDSEQENQGLRAPRWGSQSRYEELEGLLRDPGETNGGDAETMSLHSNLGIGDRQRRRRKKRRSHKSIRLFGFHLFGRPPIQLSDSEGDEGGGVSIGSRRRRQQRPGRLAVGPQLGSAYSSSSVEAFDSDASPLDPAVISQLSPEDAAACAARAAAEREAEEQRRRREQVEKEERRRRRRERKEERRAAAAAVNIGMNGEEFEGFPGSGPLRPPPLSPGSLSSVNSSNMPTTLGSPAPAEEFGPYIGATGHGDEDGEGDEADFGGDAYTRKSSSRGRGSDSSRSHTLSQSSASRSNAESSSHYFPYPQHQQQLFRSHSSPLASPSPNITAFAGQAGAGLQTHNQTQGPRENKKRPKRSSNSVATASSRSPTSQSASLPSLDSDSPRVTTEPIIVQHRDDEMLAPTLSRHEDPVEISLFPKGGNESKFPAIGLGGARRTNSSSGTAASGVFLARRGDD